MRALDLYYIVKPLLPRALQLGLRRQVVRWRRTRHAGMWPIDPQSDRPPDGWSGWPDGKSFAVVLTHDVEYAGGHDRCLALADLEEELGFRSSFNFVPERYAVSPDLRARLTGRGFEVGVHGLKHDGLLYKSFHTFSGRAIRINHYLREWGAVGFRSPAMHHNLNWLRKLHIAYDASTFDTDPFEPQSDGLGTIFPQWIGPSAMGPGYVELPYTLPQDHTLFTLMGERSIAIWKQKLDWVAARGGLALVNVHPDYMCFGNGRPGPEEYPAAWYREWLEYLRGQYAGRYWHALPREVAMRVAESARAGRLKPRATFVAPTHPARIAMVVFSNYPSDIRVRREAEALVEAGAEVDVLCLAEPGEPNRETVRGVRVFRLPLVHRRTGAWRYFLEYAGFLLWASARLTALYAGRRHDVVHVHNMPDFLVFAALVPRLAGARVILDLHDPMPELFESNNPRFRHHPLQRALVRLERWSIRFAHQVITTNLSFRNVFVARGCPPEKIEIVMNSPQESVFFPGRPAAGAAGPEPGFHLMYHGLIVERHGLDTAVRAVQSLRREMPDIRLHIYGAGEFWPAVEARIDRERLHPWIRMHGKKSIEQIVEDIRSIDLGIVPNQKTPFTDLNFPTRIFEFLCLGKPVVAPRTQGILDYFDERSLYLFEPGNADDLARAVRDAWSDPAERRRKAEAGHAIYRSYRWELQKQTLLRITGALLESRGRPPLGS
jgi:glycosyltransferase involved in cell wall biosynthesis